jgi:hypothetical protein
MKGNESGRPERVGFMYQLPALPFHVEVAASVEVVAKAEPANGKQTNPHTNSVIGSTSVRISQLRIEMKAISVP